MQLSVKNLQNSDIPFRFFFEDFHLCSLCSNVNYGAWHFYKRLFSSSVATFRLARSEISFPVNERKLAKSPGKGWTLVQFGE